MVGEELLEGRPAGELAEVVGAVMWRWLVTTMTAGGWVRRAAENCARVSRMMGMASGGSGVGGVAEEEEVGEDAGGGFEAHAVEDVVAAGDGVDALDAAGEGGAAEGLQVVLERVSMSVCCQR